MLKLHAGVSEKVGLPGFSSASASCTIEAELDSSLLQDHDGFQTVVRRAYQSCDLPPLKRRHFQRANLWWHKPREGKIPRGRKFYAEQIIGKLREAEVGLAQGKTVPEVVRKLGTQIGEQITKIVGGASDVTALTRQRASNSG
jgi:hypothetical protein